MAAQDIVDQQSAYANTAITTGNAFAQQLLQYLNFEPIIVTGLPEVQYVNRSSFINSGAVRPDALTFSTPSATEPVYAEVAIRELADVLVPDFSEAAPILAFPTAPDATLPSAPGSISVADIDIPVAPTFTSPSAPVLTAITLPDAPSITVPFFEEVLPVDDLVAPTAVFEFAEQAYSSAALDALQAKLLDDLANGGYGIEPLDEELLWERAREREQELSRAAVMEVYRRQASRGFPVPPGDLDVAVDMANRDLQNKLSTLSREIMLKRGDLYVENRKFTIQEVRQLEAILIQYHGAVQERALNAAKATLEAGIQLFNAHVAKYNAQLEAYKAYGQVFTARVQAMLAEAEIYKATIEGKKIESDIQRASIENYRAQLEAINTLVSIYRVQMEGANVRATIERSRIDGYRALVDAYKSQVEAKTAEFGMYDARIRGELGKVQAYAAQADAYKATVDGAKARADIAVAQVQADTARSRASVDSFNAKIQAYRASLESQLATIRALVDKHGAQTALYNVDTQLTMNTQNLLATLTKLEADERIANANIAIKNAELRYKSVLDAVGVRATFANTSIGMYTAQINAALGALNAVSSVSA